jgi:hypothetical protein
VGAVTSAERLSARWCEYPQGVLAARLRTVEHACSIAIEREAAVCPPRKYASDRGAELD